MAKTIEQIITKNNDLKGPSPILMVPGKGGGDGPRYWYMLRLTPMDKYDDKTVTKFLTNYHYVVGKELTKDNKIHYHICINTDLEIGVIRRAVKEFLYTFWPSDERVRGWGNAQYQLQQAESAVRAISYSIKDGDFKYSSSINFEFIQECKKKSFKKYDKVNFASEFNAIAEEFKISEMSIRDFMVKLVELKGKYRQPINMHRIYEVAISHQVHRDSWYANSVVDDFINSKR